MKNGLVNNFVYAYNLTKDKYMYLLNSDLKEYDVTYLDWLVNDFYYIYGPIMLEETVKKQGETIHVQGKITINKKNFARKIKQFASVTRMTFSVQSVELKKSNHSRSKKALNGSQSSS